MNQATTPARSNLPQQIRVTEEGAAPTVVWRVPLQCWPPERPATLMPSIPVRIADAVESAHGQRKS